MGYREEYGPLLDSIVQEGDLIAMRYFRAVEMRVDRKGDGSAVTQADRGVEEMARKKVTASGLALDVLGEEMGGRDMEAASSGDRARLIIDPIDGTEEFSRGIPTFGTLLGIEHRGEIVAGMVSAPALGTRWFAYRGEGAFRDGKKIHASSVSKLSKAMIFTTGTGPKKDANDRAKLRRLHDAVRNSRSLGGGPSRTPGGDPGTCRPRRDQRGRRSPAAAGITPAPMASPAAPATVPASNPRRVSSPAGDHPDLKKSLRPSRTSIGRTSPASTGP